MKRLSPHDDRPGPALGLVLLWELVPDAEAYFEIDSDMSDAHRYELLVRIAAEARSGLRPPDLRQSLGPAAI